MSIVEKFMTMEYGPAPEDRAKLFDGWTVTAGALDIHKRRVAGTHGRDLFRHRDPSTGEKLAAVAQGSAADVDARRRQRALHCLPGNPSLRMRCALSLCAGAAGTETLAAAGGS